MHCRRYFPDNEWVAQQRLTHEFNKSRKIWKTGNKWFLFSGIAGEKPNQDRA